MSVQNTSGRCSAESFHSIQSRSNPSGLGWGAVHQQQTASYLLEYLVELFCTKLTKRKVEPTYIRTAYATPVNV